MSIATRLLLTSLLVVFLTSISTMSLVIYDQYRPQILSSLNQDHHELVHYDIEDKSQTLVKARDVTEVLVVFLHGRGANDRSYITTNFAKELGKDENKNISVLFPDSSNHSYWHDRSENDWSSYLNSNAIKGALERLNFKNSPKMIIAGISMGGYGALLNAGLEPNTYCGVVAHSPAIWSSASTTAPGAFDNADDFEAGNIFTRVDKLHGKYVSIDIGSTDSLAPGVKEFGEKLIASNVPVYLRTFDGGHSMKYWNAHWTEYFSYYRSAASNCK